MKALPKSFGHFELNSKGHLVYKQDHTGFTPTSVFPVTGQQMKQMTYRQGKNTTPTCRKATRGRVIQRVPLYLRDEVGEFPVDAYGRVTKKIIGYKQVVHRDAGRLMNV